MLEVPMQDLRAKSVQLTELFMHLVQQVCQMCETLLDVIGISCQLWWGCLLNGWRSWTVARE